MDGDHETQKPDPATYHEYIEPINGDDYDTISVTSRDSQYEKLPPDDRPIVVPTSSHEYTPLNGLSTPATSSTTRDNATPSDCKLRLVNNLSNCFCQ